MTNQELKEIAINQGVNAAMNVLMSKPMSEYPTGLINEIKNAASRGGMSGGLITDTAEDYINNLIDN